MGQINLKGNVQNVFGKQRLVTRAERYSTIGSELIVARVAQTAGIKEANVQKAIMGIREAVRYFVLNGHSVDLGDFGAIRLVAQGKAVATKAQVSRYLLRGIKILYSPSKKVRNTLENINFTSNN